MRIKTSLLLSAFVLGASGLAAQAIVQDHSNKLDVTFTADAGVTTKHVFRGIKRSNEAITAGVKMDFTEQLIYAGAYTVQPLDGAGMSEWDAYIGITNKLNDWLNYDFGCTYYYYPNKLNQNGHGDTIAQAFEPYFGLVANIPQVPGLAASAYVYFDLNRKAFTGEVSLGYARHLTGKLGMRLSTFIGYVNASDIFPERAGSDVDEDYCYFGATAELPYHVTDRFTITLGVQFSDTSGTRNYSDGNSHFWGFGRATYNF
ncbi:TorF family putative porin [Geminisphaera colitermitum]|uniref:TorF family putative porin n=1 Tax=Geminisphaera colitermitum TaxID=1148786 RepID=UPI000158C9F3|nr:TorF family putative porin [Geminisphaera colitermitum]